MFELAALTHVSPISENTTHSREIQVQVVDWNINQKNLISKREIQVQVVDRNMNQKDQNTSFEGEKTEAAKLRISSKE